MNLGNSKPVIISFIEIMTDKKNIVATLLIFLKKILPTENKTTHKPVKSSSEIFPKKYTRPRVFVK